MNSVSSRTITSSIHIEPVNSDEYKQNLVEQLTTHHKRKFLEYVRSEPNFLKTPNQYPKLCANLVTELNRHKLKHGQTEWLNIIHTWIDLVRNGSFNVHRSNEDDELYRLILSHEQTTSNDPDKTFQTIELFASHCRICLASSSTKMLYLFDKHEANKMNTQEISLLEKLNYCSCFTINASVDDRLPQFICLSCSILVENAYQLKVLCTKTEAKLHELRQLNEKTETKQQEKGSGYILDGNGIEPIKTVEKSSHLRERKQQEDISKNSQCELDDFSTTNKDELEMEHEIHDTDDANGEIQMNGSNMKPKHQNGAINKQHMESSSKCNVGQKAVYQCGQCGKSFRVKNSLTIHMRCHTGERPYSCEVCGKAFKTSSAANNHRVVHIEAKDFKCSTCSFRTNTKANLRIHERTHTGVQPYECQICAMKFRTASNVAKHMRNIHEKQKENKCDKCSRSFFTRESLRKHSIIHTGLKPYNCPQNGCSRSYGWYNGLKKHMRIQHSDENVKLPGEKYFFDKLKNMLP